MPSHHHCHINITSTTEHQTAIVEVPLRYECRKHTTQMNVNSHEKSSFRRFVNRSSSSSSSSIHILKVRHESRVESTNDHRKHSHCCSSLPTGTRTQSHRHGTVRKSEMESITQAGTKLPKECNKRHPNTQQSLSTAHISKTVATMVMSTYILQPPFHAQPSSLSY